jgi:DNA polymerase elongation subunit (family B)
MLEHVIINKTLFLDIETVPCAADISDLSEYEQQLWKEKRGRHKPDDIDEDEFFFNNAGILAEFGKIICISMGYFVESGGERSFRVKSVYGDDEVKLLKEFLSILKRIEQNFGDKLMICGHNIKEFDIPYICRRMLIQGMVDEFPALFSRMQSAKPWELSGVLLDTLDVWRFGDYKNYISMKLLAHVLGVPSPKGDISGADVGRVYYHEGDLERIKKYCQHDVVAVASIVLKLKGLPDMKPGEVMES